MDDLVGQIMRGYEIKERIGSGGYGVVYRASQPSVDREVALKVILPTRAKTDYFINRFDAEAHLVAKLEHPHIVPLYDYWREDDSAALVMRWLPGGDLSGVLENGALSLEQVIKMLDQIGAALTLAHKQDVVHRDLKPGNVLLDDEGNFYLTDFGIAKDLKGIITADSTAGHVTGTPAYLSPEQGMGDKVTPLSDVYSLGVLLYELLTGEHPFPGADPTTQIIHHISDPLPKVSDKRSDLPKSLDDFVEIATAKKPEKRYSDIPEMVAAFHSAAGIQSAGTEQRSAPGVLEKKLGVRPYRPAFLDEAAPVKTTPERKFVGRQRQLARLGHFLEKALGGHTQLAFITGEAGRGKSALLHEFARRAESSQNNLLVVHGGCRMPSGVPDPYLPFRQAFAMLAGDVEDPYMAGEISQSQARRLWDLLPIFSQILVDAAPGLIDTLIPGRELAARAAGFDTQGQPWQSDLAHLLERKAEEILPPEKDQADIYHQAIQVFKQISSHHPVLIILDDLHWIDQASLGLLTALEQEMQTHPVLILGAYREAELAIDGGNPQALKSNLTEWKRQRGDIWINLDDTKAEEDRAFIDEYLDTEPNQLSAAFRKTLTGHTKGHGLFLQEMLRELHDRGDLKKDGEGRWVERKDITWGHLPAKVEGVIEKRIERLDDDSRLLLQVASVGGVRFSADVVAAVLGQEKSTVVSQLVNHLGDRHQLVEDLGIERLNGYRLARFQFSHSLLQNYLYAHISESQRTVWHEQVGLQMEELYSGHIETLSLELANHFEIAGELEKAITYYQMAGEIAKTSFAFSEAISSYENLARLLSSIGDENRLARALITLGFLYHSNLNYEASQNTYQKAFRVMKKSRMDFYPGTLPNPPHAYRVFWGSTDASPQLDPAKTNDVYNAGIHHLVFRGLVETPPEGGVIPDIASEWKILEGGKIYIFHLKPDAFWSDGTQVTASDFVYACRRELDPENEGGQPSNFFNVLNARKYHAGKIEPEKVGIRAIDDITLEIVLDSPAGHFLWMLTQFFPVPKHCVEKHGDDWTKQSKFVCNGPFGIEEPDPGVLIQFTRNPGYTGKFPGNLHKIQFIKSPKDPLKEVEMFREEFVDMTTLYNFPLELLPSIIQKYSKEYLTVTGPISIYATLKTDNPPFDLLEVRQAFAYAIDQDAIANEYLHGLHTAANGGILPPGIPGYVEDAGLEYDPFKAQKLLAKAGFEDGRGFPTVELVISILGDHYRAIMDYLTTAWTEVLNVKVNATRLPLREMSQKWKDGIFDIRVGGWNFLIPDPQYFHDDGKLEEFGLNSWVNENYIELISKAKRISDQGERISLFREADKLMTQDAPVIPLFYVRTHLLAKPWVKSAEVKPDLGFNEKYIIMEPHEENGQ